MTVRLPQLPTPWRARVFAGTASVYLPTETRAYGEACIEACAAWLEQQCNETPAQGRELAQALRAWSKHEQCR